MTLHRPLIDPLEPDERLSADDMAARREAEFTAAALTVQQLRAQGGAVIRRGVCAACGDTCQPLAVYCNPRCRADHEAELACQARRRKPLG